MLYDVCLGRRQDVFVLDAADKCFVWVGKGASPNEKKNGFAYAHVSHSLTSEKRLRKLKVELARKDYPLLGVAALTFGNILCFQLSIGSLAEWLESAGLRRRRAHVQIAVATLSGNSLRQTVHTHRASVH